MSTHEPGDDQCLGFELSFRTPDGWDDAERTTFWDACIQHIEQLGLAVGGGTELWWTVFVTSTLEGNSVTPSQRAALIAWLRAHPCVLQVEAGELVRA